MCVFNGLEDTRACLESLAGTTEPFRLVVMDNGSTDGTPGFFERFPYEYPLTFAKSPANDGVIASLNRAWRLADTEFLCFLHNDTEMLEPALLSRLLGALAEPDAGLAGLYGAKRLRADGRAVGRTIVHSLVPRPTVRDRKSTRLNSSHSQISYAVFCLKKKKKEYSLQHQPHFR